MEPRLRKRLEELNRGPLADSPRPKRAVGRSRQRRATRTSGAASWAQPAVVPPLRGVLRRGEVVGNARGEHLRMRLPLNVFWAQGPDLIAGRQKFIHEQRLAQHVGEASRENGPAEWTEFLRSFPNGALFLDLETCGLAGSALFLIGLLRWIDGRPCVELLLARSYAEEAALLSTFWTIAADHPVVVTFNGKSFDWPMLIDRTTRHRFQDERSSQPACHLDLLHHARRKWGNTLPDCKLQTIERHICHRARLGDIPGRAVPAAYHEFVTSGTEQVMDEVLYHNAVDLTTLLDMTMRVIE